MWPFKKSDSAPPWKPSELAHKLLLPNSAEFESAVPSGHLLLVRLDHFSNELLLGLDRAQPPAGPGPREDKQTLGIEINRPSEALGEEEATINTKVSKEQLVGAAKERRLPPPELRSSPCFLVQLPGGSAGSETWSIGRASSHALVLRHPSVSKSHAQLQAGASYCLRDLGSRNGTFVNGVPITGPHWLEDGDALKLGAVQMWFVKAKSLWRAFHG